MVKKEFDLYKPMSDWLYRYLEEKYGNSYKIITTSESHSKSLYKVLENNGIVCESAFGLDIQIDILGIIKNEFTYKLFFIEAKLNRLKLKDLGQLWAYCKLIDPEEAFLFSGKGIGCLDKIVNILRRDDILDYGDRARIKKMKVAKWDIIGKRPSYITMYPKLY